MLNPHDKTNADETARPRRNIFAPAPEAALVSPVPGVFDQAAACHPHELTSDRAAARPVAQPLAERRTLAPFSTLAAGDGRVIVARAMAVGIVVVGAATILINAFKPGDVPVPAPSQPSVQTAPSSTSGRARPRIKRPSRPRPTRPQRVTREPPRSRMRPSRPPRRRARPRPHRPAAEGAPVPLPRQAAPEKPSSPAPAPSPSPARSPASSPPEFL